MTDTRKHHAKGEGMQKGEPRNPEVGLTLLLVDDDPGAREVLREILKDESYHLLEAENGREALAMIHEGRHRVDVMVLDRLMPELNGLDVVARLKVDDRWKWIPVIMATAAGTAQEICEGMEAGVFFYLIKPFTPDTLIRIVRAAVVERLKWQDIHHSLAAQSQCMQFLRRGRFQIRTMEEAYSLAIFLAGGCADPDKAAFGFHELLCNAVEHGNLGIGYAEKTRLLESHAWEKEIAHRMEWPENLTKVVEVDVEQHPETLKVTITDEGIGFDWRAFEVLHPDRMYESHGRGIAMAKKLSFRYLEYQGIGNQVSCEVERRLVEPVQQEALFH